MKKSLVLLALSGALLTACGGKSGDGKSHSKESDGRCTSAFVNDYNNTNNALSNAETKRKRAGVTGSTYDMDQAKKAIAASHATCGAFFKAHGSVTCRAERLGDGAMNVASSELKSGCDQVAKYHQILSSGVTGATPAGSPIAAPESSDPVNALSPSVEADGSCSDDFVRDYNAVFARGQDLKNAVALHRQTESAEDWMKVLDGLKTVVSVCDQFEIRHPEVSCKSASVHMSTGVEVTVGTDNYKEYCTSIRDIEARASQLP